MSCIVPLDAAHDRSRCGGKAAALAAMRAAGLPVPDGFVIVAQDATSTTEQFEAQVRKALRALCPRGEAVAVRSSAIDEDGEALSFAGQYESFLCVPHARVLERIRDVRRSGTSARVAAYRQQRAGGSACAPAVLVQRMVDAESAGVAFSIDPVSGATDIAVVSATPGLGNGLVGGKCDADTYRIDLRGRIASQELTEKAWAYRAGTDDIRRVDLPATARTTSTLSPRAATSVAQLARRCAQLAGTPQDIEWAIGGGTLHLLQSRPVTTHAATQAPGTATIWDNSNIVESYGGVTTPLTFSYIRRNYACVYRQLCRLARVSEDAITAHDDVFWQMLGLVRGRVYYNLSSWYRVLALVPGFRHNRPLLDQMLGIHVTPSAEVTGQIAASSARRWLDSARILCAVVGHQLTLQRCVTRFKQRLEAALVAPQPPLEQRNALELVAYQRDLDRQLLHRWDAPLVNDFFLMVFHGVLKRLVAKWLPDTEPCIDNHLLSDTRGMISVEPARRIEEMAALASYQAGFRELLCDAPLAAIMSAMPDGFSQRYQDYLHTFGDRSHDELKLESPSLHDDPLPLLRAIGATACRGVRVREAGDGVRVQAERQVARALSRHPLRRRLFGWVLRNTRDRLRGRENLRFARTRAFARARRVFVELGKRLHADGVLAAPRDVFMLELDEMFGCVEGTATTRDLRGLVAVRHADFERNRIEPPPPDRFETRGPLHAVTFDAVAQVQGDHDVRSGRGCGPGVVRGPVRIISDPSSARIDHGCVLVTERTDPGWVVLFPLAAGLIVERGSLLSHAAIVARELGLPTVINLAGACQWLRDGDWVEIDGSSGVVRRIAPVALTSIETSAVDATLVDATLDAVA